jgi:hypothetical protein
MSITILSDYLEQAKEGSDIDMRLLPFELKPYMLFGVSLEQKQEGID